MRSSQELCRKICHGLGSSVRFGKRGYRGDIAIHHAVANGVREGHVPIVARRVPRQFALEAMQVIDQSFDDCVRTKAPANVHGSVAPYVGLGVSGNFGHRKSSTSAHTRLLANTLQTDRFAADATIGGLLIGVIRSPVYSRQARVGYTPTASQCLSGHFDLDQSMQDASGRLNA